MRTSDMDGAVVALIELLATLDKLDKFAYLDPPK